MGEEASSTAMVQVSVREFDPNKDRESVEAVERICEVGPSGKLSLFTDLHGDPITRVRNSPTFLMLVIILIILLTTNQSLFFFLSTFLFHQFTLKTIAHAITQNKPSLSLPFTKLIN